MSVVTCDLKNTWWKDISKVIASSPLLSQATAPHNPTRKLNKLHHKTSQAAACHPLLLLKAVPELPSSAACKPAASFQTEFIKWNPFRLAFWMHNFNPAGGGSRGWWDFFAFLLFHKSGITFPSCRQHSAWMKGGDELSVRTFPSHAGNVPAAAELSAISCHSFLQRPLSPRQSFFFMVRLTPGQLIAGTKYLYQLLVQNPRQTTITLQAVHSQGVHRFTRPNMNVIKFRELQQKDGLVPFLDVLW